MMVPLRQVDFARGQRNYITAVDIFNSAPITQRDTFFEFRFSRFANAPGKWIDGTNAAEDLNLCPITVVVKDGERRARFGFLEDLSSSLRRVADLDSGLTDEMLTVNERRASCPVSAERDPWAQLIDMLRFFGMRLFGIQTWAVLRLSGTGTCTTPFPVAATTLEMEFLTTRSGVYRVRYWLKDNPRWNGFFMGAEMKNMPRTEGQP